MVNKSGSGKKKRDPEPVNPFAFLSEKKECVIQIRIGHGLLAWIDCHAEDNNMNRSSVIMQALVEYAGKVEGVREARNHSLMEMLKRRSPDQIRLTPTGDGSYIMEVVKPGVVTPEGEEVPTEKGES
ncbi:hypothetical protein LCGC14_0430440 [marine sediment metagenome]|uniref:Uncharacterized protein n=1 Tax=marine sediment metagenome TaxID=412755 RepID=A0A0F9VA97_9ZZZZ